MYRVKHVTRWGEVRNKKKKQEAKLTTLGKNIFKGHHDKTWFEESQWYKKKP